MINRYFILTTMLALILSGCKGEAPVSESAEANSKLTLDEAKSADSAGSASTFDSEKAMDEDAPVFVESCDEYEKTNPDDSSGRPYFIRSTEKVALDDASKEKYPELAKAWEEYTNANYKKEDSLSEEYFETSLQADEDSYETLGLPFDLSTGYNIERCDSHYVSAVYYSNGFGGGAHPWDDWESKTFDVMTGEEVLLSRFIPDKEALFTYLKDYFAKDAEYSFYDEWEDALSETVENSYKDIDKVKNSEEYIPVLNWALCTDGIEINFDHYTIAPRVEGDISVVIPYTENIVDKDAVFPDKAEDN